MEKVRLLNEEGAKVFREYVARLRADSKAAPPRQILQDGMYSDPFDPEVQVDLLAFESTFQFGAQLVEWFAKCEERLISRNHALWNWLALYFFDQICKPGADGSRKVLEEAVYVLEQNFSFRKYYRHAVRTPWLAVREHQEHAKVLLLTSGKGTRSDIAEQLGAYQHLFQNKTVIGAAYRLYFDPVEQRPRRGAGGKGAGSARRLATIAQQLELTYDLEDCGEEKFETLLPAEFGRWMTAAGSAA